MDTILPWQHPLWSKTMAMHQQMRLPHALLLTGQEGMGKQHFAQQLAQALLCEQPRQQGVACGQCHGCMMYQAGTHPDSLEIVPEEAGKAIKVDQIRALTASLGLTRHAQGYRAVIISPAERMNPNAANCLLKTLEEPPAKTLLMLVTSRPSALAATIRSRCQQLKFGAPAANVAIDWLRPQLSADRDASLLLSLANNAPLAALELAQGETMQQRQSLLEDLMQLANGQADPVALAAVWLKRCPELPINWLYSWVIDMIRLKYWDAAPVANPDIKATLLTLVQRVQLLRLFGLLDQISGAIQLTHTQVNKLMVLEGILLHWANLSSTARVKQ